MDFLRRGDDGYDDERTGFQLAGAHEPDLIAPVTGADDVREAVYRARQEEMAIGVQATGHGVRTPMQDGMLISTRRMTGVDIDVRARRARIEAGAHWTPVIAQATTHGLAPLSGAAPHVGVVGYTLAGGIGLMARRYGYAADHVRSIDVVTYDGEQRHVTADSDPERFWALRGGRDLIGIVTAIEVDLFPVATLYGGTLVYAIDDAARVIDAWRELTATAPDDLTSSIALIPPAGIVQVRIAHLGDGGADLIHELRALKPTADSVADMPYSETHKIHDDPTEPTAFYGAHALVDEFETSAISDPRCVVEVRHLGGALAREPETPSAIGNRDALYSVALVARAPAQEEFDRILGRLESRGFALNFLAGEQATEANLQAAYDPENWDRLARFQPRVRLA